MTTAQPVTALRFPPARIAEARTRRALSVVIGAAVPLKKQGAEYAGICPFHNDHSPSLNVNDRKGLWVCRVCDAGGDAISFVERFYGKSFHEAVEELAGAPYESSVAKFERKTREAAAEYSERPSRKWEADAEERARMAQARSIWNRAVPPKGTLAESYLRGRAISKRLPPSLRFSPSLYFWPLKREMPALIAALQDSGGNITAVQRIFLDPATGKKAEPAKEAKRTKGPMHDGAVRLGKPGRILGIAEGVETALSASQIYSLPVWAALGARMKAIKLPAEVEEVMIFRDNGAAGLDMAVAAAELWEDQGRRVMIEAPPAELGDWNDVLKARG